MNNKNTRLITLGLLIAGAAMFGIIGVTKQVTTSHNTASAASESVTNDEKNMAIDEIKNEKQQQKLMNDDASQQQEDQSETQIETEQTEQEQPEQVQTIATDTQNETAVVEPQVQVEEVSFKQDTNQEQTVPANNTPVQQEQAKSEIPSMTLSLAGTNISYQNGGSNGQAVIDANPYNMASTFGGAGVQSGTDNMNTHFIGHNPGIFSSVFNLGIGNQITVTDTNGTPTTYTVSQIIQVDDYGFGINDGVDYYDTIVGAGGGERITLQTCITDTENLIVIAYA